MNTDILSLPESLVDDYKKNGPPSGAKFTGTEGAYLLPHTEVEIERLQRQHRFLGSATNLKLLQYPLQSRAKVLDSGCADGTFNCFSCFLILEGMLLILCPRNLAQGSELSVWESTRSLRC